MYIAIEATTHLEDDTLTVDNNVTVTAYNENGEFEGWYTAYQGRDNEFDVNDLDAYNDALGAVVDAAVEALPWPVRLTRSEKYDRDVYEDGDPDGQWVMHMEADDVDENLARVIREVTSDPRITVTVDDAELVVSGNGSEFSRVSLARDDPDERLQADVTECLGYLDDEDKAVIL